MAIATWKKDICAAVVTVLLADTDLMTVVKKVERGLIDPINSQVVIAGECPYVSVTAPHFTPDTKQGPKGFTQHVVQIRCAIVTMGMSQSVVELQQEDIQSQLAIIVGHQKSSTPFAINTSAGRAVLCEAGGGTIEAIDHDAAPFRVGGAYEFNITFEIHTAS